MSTARERPEGEEVGKKTKRDLSTADASLHRMARRLPLGPAGGMLPSTALNTATPCAACKLLRRRCAQECPFFPYFSPHEPQKFASVHKVFGASNVSKMLLEVPESQRADAANSLVYEANLRLRDPVYGCMGVISALQQQVQALEAELAAVKSEVLKHKYRPTAAASMTAAVLPPSTSTHAATFLAASAAGVSVAAPPPPLAIAAAAPAPAPASSSSSMYTAASSSTDYSSVTNENAPYFG